ncbi:MAG: alpha/beta fold hydrolase [Gemmatimonadales bacterium]
MPSTAALSFTVQGTGAPVVLLHGLGSSKADWGPQVAALSAGYRTIAVDLRGHGESPHPEGPWTLRDFAADVAELLRRLDAAPAHVIGLSLGGMVAFQLLADHPALVRSAVIINSGPAYPRTWQGQVLIWSRLLLLRWRGLPALGGGIAARLFPKPEQAEHLRRFLAGFVRNDPAAYSRTLRAIGGFDVSAGLAGMRCPVLALSGDRDYTPVSAKAAWVGRMPEARLEVVPDSGHASPIDQPDTVNRLIAEFLASVPAAAA